MAAADDPFADEAAVQDFGLSDRFTWLVTGTRTVIVHQWKCGVCGSKALLCVVCTDFAVVPYHGILSFAEDIDRRGV